MRLIDDRAVADGRGSIPPLLVRMMHRLCTRQLIDAGQEQFGVLRPLAKEFEEAGAGDVVVAFADQNGDLGEGVIEVTGQEVVGAERDGREVVCRRAAAELGDARLHERAFELTKQFCVCRHAASVLPVQRSWTAEEGIECGEGASVSYGRGGAGGERLRSACGATGLHLFEELTDIEVARNNGIGLGDDAGGAIEVLLDDEAGEPDNLADGSLVLPSLFVDLDFAADDPLVARVRLQELAEMVGSAIVEVVLEEDIDLAHLPLELIARERATGLGRLGGSVLERQRSAGRLVVGVEREDAPQDPLFQLTVPVFVVADGKLAEDGDGAPLLAHRDQCLNEEFERIRIVGIALKQPLDPGDRTGPALRLGERADELAVAGVVVGEVDEQPLRYLDELIEATGAVEGIGSGVEVLPRRQHEFVFCILLGEPDPVADMVGVQLHHSGEDGEVGAGIARLKVGLRDLVEEQQRIAEHAGLIIEVGEPKLRLGLIGRELDDLPVDRDGLCKEATSLVDEGDLGVGPYGIAGVVGFEVELCDALQGADVIVVLGNNLLQFCNGLGVLAFETELLGRFSDFVAVDGHRFPGSRWEASSLTASR